MTGVRKVVYAASGGTLYGEPRKLPVKETARTGSRPESPYGISKKVVIDYLSYYERYHGLDWTALALANVYGPRQDPDGEAGVVAIFSSKMLAGEAPTIFGDGNQTRDYVFVDDVVHAFALAAERGSGRLVNVGTAMETSVNGLYRMLSGYHRVRGRARPTGRRARAIFAAALGYRARRRRSSGGSRGRTSKTASPRRSPSSGDRPAVVPERGVFPTWSRPQRRGHHEPWPPSSRSVRQTPSNACSGSW